MNKEKILVYFIKKSQGKNETESIQINFSDRKRGSEKISSRNSCED